MANNSSIIDWKKLLRKHLEERTPITREEFEREINRITLKLLKQVVRE